MALPGGLADAETTITVLRGPTQVNGEWPDPYDPEPTPETVVSGVRAVITSPSGREREAGGQQSVSEMTLTCDPFTGGLQHEDEVRDDRDGSVYQVTWSQARFGMELDHFKAGLRQVKGLV